MDSKLLTAVALTFFIGAGLTACSTPVEEVAPIVPAPAVEAEGTVSEPDDTFIEFAENAEPIHDGVPVVCEQDGEGQSATAARVMTADAENPHAVKGDTTFFVVECSYPATDEIMAVIEEMNASQQ